MEGRLRRVGDSWEGELHGYKVYTREQVGQWLLWLSPRGEWVERCLRCESFGHAVWLARAWIEIAAIRGCGRRRGMRRCTRTPSSLMADYVPSRRGRQRDDEADLN